MNKYENLNVVVCNSGVEQIWDVEEDTCYVTYALNGRNSKILSIIRKAWLKYRLPAKEIWYNKKVLELEGKGVLLDDDITEDYAAWLIRNNRKIQWNFYYWNSYEHYRIAPDTLRRLGYCLWSFDPNNCKQFSLKFNPTFFCKSWYRGLKKITHPTYDIVFIGRDKNGRMKQIKDLKERFKSYDISWNFYFTANKWYRRFCSKEYKPYLNFYKMLEQEMSAKAILDFSQDMQSSITCRVYDALYNERKVITNNVDIRKMNYYSPDNIFILDYDDDTRLEGFLKTPFKTISWELLREHSCERWSRVICEGKSYTLNC
jgi:hypothetical protein